jgi:ribosomal protein S18 acetylase RimI-like enzyme
MLPSQATQAFLRDDEPADFTEQCWQDFHVADIAGRIVGLLFVAAEKIESLHLDPEEKRKGYGSLLMDKAERLVAGNGFAAATLDVLKDNTDAILFYKARGYTVVKEFTGREAGDTPVQMYLMERDISAG